MRCRLGHGRGLLVAPRHVDPLLVAAALRREQKAGKVLAEFGLRHLFGQIKQLPFVLRAPLASSVQKDDQRVAFPRLGVSRSHETVIESFIFVITAGVLDGERYVDIGQCLLGRLSSNESRNRRQNERTNKHQITHCLPRGNSNVPITNCRPTEESDIHSARSYGVPTAWFRRSSVYPLTMDGPSVSQNNLPGGGCPKKHPTPKACRSIGFS